VKKRILLSGCCALVLAGCSKGEQATEGMHAEFLAPRLNDAYVTSAPAAPAPPAAPAAAAGAPAQASPIAVTVPQLAYRYEYGLETPASAISGLVAHHEAACRAAGPTVCQITGSKVVQESKSRVSGELSMRAQPGWLATFRAGLEGDAKTAGGKVMKSDTTTEDLSTQIVDTEAAVRARITLRDRLQNLLATRPGKLEELLQLEQQLAQVQGEIDAAQSNLAMMRQRVASSAITVEYRSKGSLSEDGAWAPVAQAIRGSQGAMAATIGFLIIAFSVLLPLAIVFGAIGYVILRFRRQRKAKARAAKASAADSPKTAA